MKQANVARPKQGRMKAEDEAWLVGITTAILLLPLDRYIPYSFLSRFHSGCGQEWKCRIVKGGGSRYREGMELYTEKRLQPATADQGMA